MTWNYRVMKRKNELGEFEFGIYEVYYDEAGKKISCTEKSLTPLCPSPDDLLHELTLMMEAFKDDTLTFGED